MQQSASRRKTLLVNKTFQKNMIFQYVAMNIQTAVIFAILLFIIMQKSISSMLPAETARDVAAAMILPMIGFIALYVLITSALIAFYVVHSSNRIAGPIYRFNAVIKEMSQGNLVPAVSIRDGDHLMETSELFKILSSNLAGDFSIMKRTIHELNQHALSKGDNSLIDKVGRLRDLTEKYRVEHTVHE
ncbi:MAG: hypothetical protein CVV44_11030 [Spirochaetae bacterium HGW-Spirochaetae-1]|nr:MAG: hypothetical protein CVV44_11030 [Spirochaetae bacterium HGW-Spirochaetae-1]